MIFLRTIYILYYQSIMCNTPFFTTYVVFKSCNTNKKDWKTKKDKKYVDLTYMLFDELFPSAFACKSLFIVFSLSRIPSYNMLNKRYYILTMMQHYFPKLYDSIIYYKVLIEVLIYIIPLHFIV